MLIQFRRYNGEHNVNLQPDTTNEYVNVQNVNVCAIYIFSVPEHPVEIRLIDKTFGVAVSSFNVSLSPRHLYTSPRYF